MESGEAEYIPWISKRWLSTNIPLRIPFRVDIVFKTDEASIKLFHDKAMLAINMGNDTDSRRSQDELCITQPVFGNFFSYKGRGRINKNQYNHLTWIVGEKHFAAIINSEVRYCGINFLYMKTNFNLLQAFPVIIGSDHSYKIYIKSISVSKLKQTKQLKIKKGEVFLITKQSNNMIPIIHNLITMHYGENYWFNGCMRYLMECLGEKDFDYWFFSGVTGDNLAQVYPYDHFRGCAVSDYLMSKEYIKKIFDACGYEFTYVSEKELNSNKEMYISTLMAYIDKGIPVIAKPWKIICGYEEHGKTLLYMTSDNTEPKKYTTTDGYIAEDWIFAGAKRKDADFKNIYHSVILDMPRLLTVKTDEYCFGAEAFRAWANDIESSKYNDMKPEEFDQFTCHTVYVCNVATNGSCRCFLEKAIELNPDMLFLNEILEIFKKIGELWSSDLESIGGGFNITLDALQDEKKQKAIADKIREFAVCYDNILIILKET